MNKNNLDLVTEIYQKNPALIVELVTKFYPLINKQLADFQDILLWNQISNNLNIKWNYELIDKYKNKLEAEFKFDFYIKRDTASVTIRRLNYEKRNQFVDIYDDLSSSNKVPWTIKLIDEFSDKWNWRKLSKNNSIPFNLDLIKQFESNWDWNYLSNNRSAPLTIEIIEAFENRWNWDILSGANNDKNLSLWVGLNEIPWTFEILKKFENRWNWRIISCNGNYYNQEISLFFLLRSSPFELFPWDFEVIECFKKKWDWRYLSHNPKLPWSEELIDKYLDKWDWDEICKNPGIPWTKNLIYKYYGNIELKYENIRKNWHILGNKGIPERFLNPNWWHISYSKKIEWSLELLEEFEDVFNFKNVLSKCSDLPWSEELLQKFFDKWHWYYLSQINIGWSEDLIEKYSDKWNWTCLSKNQHILFTESLLVKYQDKWDWRELSSNNSIVWTSYLLEIYKTKLKWLELSYNKNLPWVDGLFQKFEVNWDWDVLSRNEGVIFTIKDVAKHAENIYASEKVWILLRPYLDSNLLYSLFLNQK